MGSDIVIPTSIGVKESGTSFYYSFSFLPKPKRDALKTLYVFCRATDDIVDNEKDAVRKIEVLRRWRNELESGLNGKSNYRILNQLNTVAKTFRIPVEHFYDLLKGVEMDLVKNRYQTFGELKEYCYLVASTVGLMSLGIFGSKDEKTREYAINLGIALQLTNIIRDVGIDSKYGRVYIPQEDLRRFRCTESDLFSFRYSEVFRKLMEFETERAEAFYKIAQDSLPREERRVMFAAKIMERIYYHTLLRIKEIDYNVFDKPVSVPRLTQFLIALKYWIKQRVFGR